MSGSWDVVGIGANSVDLVCVVPALPRSTGELAKMRVREQFTFAGGQMATAMATCASLGLRAAYAGAIGDDHNGRRLGEALSAHGVDLSGVRERHAPNRSAVILVDETSGERVVLWYRDDALQLLPEDAPEHLIAAARLVHVDDEEEEASLRAARLARARGIPCTSDLDRLTRLTPELVATVTLPIFAEHLTAQLTGEADQERALRKLRRTHEGLLVVTLGARGAAYLEDDRFEVVPGFSVRALDTTGAGDVFRGAFVFALLNRWATRDAVRFANAAAAVSCTRRGALNGVPERDEIDSLIAAHVERERNGGK